MVVRALLLLLFGLIPSWAVAHPHVWVDVRVEAVLESSTVQGLWVEMTLDEVYSSMILDDTAPQAKALDAKAIEAIRTSYFKDLAYFDYLTHLRVGKKALPVPEPQQFSASLAAGRVTYRFYLPLKVSLAKDAVLSASFYDESYYVDVGFAARDALVLTAQGAGKATMGVPPRSSKSDADWIPPAALELRWKP